jgi:polar amino acid transport system substrate-binding protein
VKALVTHRFPFDRALDAYEMILKGKEPHLAVLFEYRQDKQPQVRTALPASAPPPADRVALGVIGAGNFARGVLLPRFKENAQVSLRAVATARGMTANAVAKQFGITVCANSSQEVLADKGINTVLIATRHNLHGPLVAEALKAGKNVFVEKPLCLTIQQLREIAELSVHGAGCTAPSTPRPLDPSTPGTLSSTPLNPRPLDPSDPRTLSSLPSAPRPLGPLDPPILMVGFNRRFSPFLKKAAEILKTRPGPLFTVYTVNAGMLPKESWVQDPVEGGGRIVGEVCHFVDALRFLAASPVKSVQAICVQTDDKRQVNRDSVSIVLKYANGSVGTIIYHAVGSPDFPKERIELARGGATVVIDDFRRMEVFGSKKESMKGSQDKGFKAEVEAFVNAATGKGPAPIPLSEIIETTLVTFAVHEALNKGIIVSLDEFAPRNEMPLLFN